MIACPDRSHIFWSLMWSANLMAPTSILSWRALLVILSFINDFISSSFSQFLQNFCFLISAWYFCWQFLVVFDHLIYQEQYYICESLLIAEDIVFHLYSLLSVIAPKCYLPLIEIFKTSSFNDFDCIIKILFFCLKHDLQYYSTMITTLVIYQKLWNCQRIVRRFVFWFISFDISFRWSRGNTPVA